MCSMWRGGGELSGKVCYFYSQPAGVQDFWKRFFYFLCNAGFFYLTFCQLYSDKEGPLLKATTKIELFLTCPHMFGGWFFQPGRQGGGRECDAHFAIYLNLDMKECLYLRRWFSRPKQVFVEWTLITFASWKKKETLTVWQFESSCHTW